MYKLIVMTDGAKYEEEWDSWESITNSVNEWFIEAMHFNYGMVFSMYENDHLIKVGTLSRAY